MGKSHTKHSYTDCRDKNGITVSLIDSIIAIARVLKERLNKKLNNSISQALSDLSSDDDLSFIMKLSRSCVKNEDQIYITKLEARNKELEEALKDQMNILNYSDEGLTEKCKITIAYDVMESISSIINKSLKNKQNENRN